MRSRVTYPVKRCVYIVRSTSDPARRYVGRAADVTTRLAAHNAGQTRSTASRRSWAIDVCVECKTEAVAMRFERYLKSGAGHACANRHFAER